MNIQTLSSVLSAAILDDRTFVEAEALYAECFKSAETFTVESNCYSREELIQDLMQDMYKVRQSTSFCGDFSDNDDGEIEDYESDDCRYDYDEQEVIHPGFSREMAEQIVDSNQPFVWLVNYKGEEEGYTLASRAVNLRTFVSKHNYM
jgi:hypothetical protein